MSNLDRSQVRLSRRMSLVLRHRPEVAGITLDRQGWVEIPVLLTALGITRDELDAIVAGNDKQRFAIEGDRIRASQGHSSRVGVELDLVPALPPGVLYHGTPAANLPSIRATGLRPGSRDHVHLSPDEETARIVGRRRTSDVAILTVNTGAMAEAGHIFYQSANGVWLTAAVPPAYLTET